MSLIFVLFGSLFFPGKIFTSYISPLLFMINILSGFLFVIKNLFQMRIIIVVFVIVLGIFLFGLITNKEDTSLNYLRLLAYFVFYSFVTFKIIRQVWNSERVDRSVIFGLMSGYISLGLLGFFTFYCIELFSPGSFHGILRSLPIVEKIEDLIYFSYITLMTVGYGDISPVSEIAKKATVLLGMMGQFYLVIVTAVVIEKYIRDTHKSI